MQLLTFFICRSCRAGAVRWYILFLVSDSNIKWKIPTYHHEEGFSVASHKINRLPKEDLCAPPVLGEQSRYAG